jgi:multiple sugar transport system ATP-binding protein
MAGVRLANVQKSFADVHVLKDINLQINDGEFVVFVGPSGCGKSTLLRTIAGLEEITSGMLHVGDKLVNDVPPSDRGIAMVFQSYALYPHMNLFDNMAFGLQLAKVPKDEIAKLVHSAAKTLNIDHLLDRKPKALSGGQRQRVAIGRAIVRKPEVFLFDEPLSNLDTELRVRMRYEFAKLHEDLKTTMIYVTHDQVEAMTLADRIVVLRDGRIEQVGTPMELYDSPVNEFVAGFIGSPRMNFLKGEITSVQGDEASVKLTNGTIVNTRISSPAPSAIAQVNLGLRPENIRIDNHSKSVSCPVKFVESLGSQTQIYCEMPGMEELVTVVVNGTVRVKAGDVVPLAWNSDDCYVFGAADGKALTQRTTQAMRAAA